MLGEEKFLVCMIKWYSAEKRALWGEGTHGYMGLGFD